MTNDTTQSSNIVGGHVAGRDVNVYHSNTPTSLGRLIKKFREEAENHQNLSNFIGELKIFTRTVPNEQVQGLEAKLRAGNREDRMFDALELKEFVYERLKENIASPTFQHVYAYLMSIIKDRFLTYVRPAIEDGRPRHDIDRIIFEDVINPTLRELETCGEPHEFTSQQLNGMLYFLAGNCHIRWH